MIFDPNSNGTIEVIDWVDGVCDDVSIGCLIADEEDGFWRFQPNGAPLTCGMLKRISIKLSELNKEIAK